MTSGPEQPTTTVTDDRPPARVPDQREPLAPVGSHALNDALTALFRLVAAGVR